MDSSSADTPFVSVHTKPNSVKACARETRETRLDEALKAILALYEPLYPCNFVLLTSRYLCTSISLKAEFMTPSVGLWREKTNATLYSGSSSMDKSSGGLIILVLLLTVLRQGESDACRSFA